MSNRKNGQGGVNAPNGYNNPLGHPDPDWRPSEDNMQVGMALARGGRGAGLRELEAQNQRGQTGDSKEKK